jgi:PadR family transcriptional regulator, regulatory protein AphA
VSTTRLTDTSYAVLGLVEQVGPVTPYRLKQTAEQALAHLWSIRHTPLYTECARLAEAGLLDEQREPSGRRRRTYRVTEAGRTALSDWLADANTDLYELRDPGLLKLFFGADPRAVADDQMRRHQEQLEAFRALTKAPELTAGMRVALQAGIGHEREYVRFWRRLAAADPAP